MASRKSIRRLDKWSYDGVVRKDFRQTKAGPEELPIKKKAKKNKPCKKSPDRIHLYEQIKDYSLGLELMWHEYRCAYCGKVKF